MLPPSGSPERQRAAELMRLERQLFSAWLQWLCNGWCAGREWERSRLSLTQSVPAYTVGSHAAVRPRLLISLALRECLPACLPALSACAGATSPTATTSARRWMRWRRRWARLRAPTSWQVGAGVGVGMLIAALWACSLQHCSAAQLPHQPARDTHGARFTSPAVSPACRAVTAPQPQHRGQACPTHCLANALQTLAWWTSPLHPSWSASCPLLPTIRASACAGR